MKIVTDLLKLCGLSVLLLINTAIAAQVGNIDPIYSAAHAKAFLLEAEHEIQVAQENMGDAWYLRDHMRFKDKHVVNQDFDNHVTNLLNIMNKKVANYGYQAAEFDHLKLNTDIRRRLNFLKLALSSPTPENAEQAANKVELVSDIRNILSKGKYCDKKDECQDLSKINQTMSSSRDYEQLLKVYKAGQQISQPMRSLFQQQVTLTNQGAQRLGYADMGGMWDSQYEI